MLSVSVTDNSTLPAFLEALLKRRARKDGGNNQVTLQTFRAKPACARGRRGAAHKAAGPRHVMQGDGTWGVSRGSLRAPCSPFPSPRGILPALEKVTGSWGWGTAWHRQQGLSSEGEHQPGLPAMVRTHTCCRCCPLDELKLA